MVSHTEVLLFIPAISHLAEDRLIKICISVIDESNRKTSYAKSRDEVAHVYPPTNKKHAQIPAAPINSTHQNT